MEIDKGHEEEIGQIIQAIIVSPTGVNFTPEFLLNAKIEFGLKPVEIDGVY